MKSTMIAKVEKRIMAVMLSLVMVVGVFAGVKLDVRAANTWKYENLSGGEIISMGDTLQAPDGKYIDTIFFFDSKDNNVDSISFNRNKKITQWDFTPPNKFLNYEFKVKDKPEEGMFNDYWYLSIYLIPKETQPVETTGEVTSNKLPTNKEVPSHICNFQWVTTIDPQAGADGLEEYKCVYCGAVQESHPIPAGVAAVKDFYGKVKDAPENGTVTYDSGKLYTISDYLLKKMSERNDVTLTVNFEYQNAKYELTFPAGTDFTPVLTDEETMYGYFGVAAKLGLTVAAK